MRAIAFDAMGVLYDTADDLRQLLVPFVRARGCSLTDEEIHRAYRQAMLGALTTSELWHALGVGGDAGDLNRAYVTGYRLLPGVSRLLEDLRDRDCELGCISNDVGEWSRARRAAFGLDRQIGHWTVSSEVRARKPDATIYQAFLASCGRRAKDVVFVDDRPANIAAASALGFPTVLVDFSATAERAKGTAGSIEELRATLIAMVDD